MAKIRILIGPRAAALESMISSVCDDKCILEAEVKDLSIMLCKNARVTEVFSLINHLKGFIYVEMSL